MQRRFATTRLIVETLRMMHDRVVMLSDLERGADMHAAGTVDRMV